MAEYVTVNAIGLEAGNIVNVGQGANIGVAVQPLNIAADAIGLEAGNIANLGQRGNIGVAVPPLNIAAGAAMRGGDNFAPNVEIRIITQPGVSVTVTLPVDVSVTAEIAPDSTVTFNGTAHHNPPHAVHSLDVPLTGDIAYDAENGYQSDASTN